MTQITINLTKEENRIVEIYKAIYEHKSKSSTIKQIIKEQEQKIQVKLMNEKQEKVNKTNEQNN